MTPTKTNLGSAASTNSLGLRPNPKRSHHHLHRTARPTCRDAAHAEHLQATSRSSVWGSKAAEETISRTLTEGLRWVREGFWMRGMKDGIMGGGSEEHDISERDGKSCFGLLITGFSVGAFVVFVSVSIRTLFRSWLSFLLFSHTPSISFLSKSCNLI